MTDEKRNNETGMRLTMSEASSIGLVILGMHRSGTSALSGVLGLLGVATGDDLLAPVDSVNPKGFFEHRAIVDIHEQLLTLLDTSWQDERPLPDDWWLDKAVEGFRQQIIDTIQNDFGRFPLWLAKDPRMCRLLPLWHSVFQHLGAEPRVIFVLRHPLEVSDSLRQRDGIAVERGLLLWLRHVIEAEEYSRNDRRVMIRYEQLISDWKTVIGKINEKLGLPLDFESGDTKARIDAFIDLKLRHHRAPVDSRLTGLAGLAESAYQILTMSHEPKEIASDMQRIKIELQAYAEAVAPWSTEIQERLIEIRNLSALEEKLRQAEYNADILQQEIYRVKQTLSWKVTKPFRLLSALRNPRNSGMRG
jgi:hypothetical protein